MTSLIESILNKDYITADMLIAESFESIMVQALFEAKKKTAAKMCEMDVSQEKPATADIEDRRKEQGVNSSIKTNLGGEQEIASGKSDLPKKQTVNTSGKGDLKEEELDEARVKLIKARVRNGKIQRRKKVSNVPGMTLRGGRLKRMSPKERRDRRMGQKRGKIKRRAKMHMAIMKRKRSLRKRATIGL